MMVQEAIVFLVVALATANLVRIWSGSLQSKSGCGKCGGCNSKSSASPTKAPPQLVQLQVNLKSKGE